MDRDSENTSCAISCERTYTVAGSLLLGGAVTAALALAIGGAPAAAVAAPDAEWHVCPAGPPACNFAMVQEAVDAAGPGDVIKVAEGVYTDIHVREGMTQVVYITESVTIRGGYSTAEWGTSDPDAHPTTLDAGGQARVAVIEGDQGQPGTVTLEGLRLTNGRPLGHDWGAGIYARYARVVISGCHVFSNSAGSTAGGVYILYSDDALLRSNEIYSNAAGSGAGAYILESPDARVEDNRVYANQAVDYGGAGIMVNRSDGVQVSGNEIHHNAAPTSGGGGVALLTSDHVTMAHNLVYANAAQWGGGINISGPAEGVVIFDNDVHSNRSESGPAGGIGLITVSDAVVRYNRITGNTATVHGGGLYVDGGPGLTVLANQIYSNTASELGGGVYVFGSAPFTMVNNFIAGNGATVRGGGLYLQGYEAAKCKGRAVHNTLVDNSHGEGGEAFCLWTYAIVTLTNNIVAGHEVGLYARTGWTNTVAADHTLFYDNDSDTEGSNIVSTHAITGRDPLFADPSSWDYHIRRDSPAMNAGAVTGWVLRDVDGDARPLGDGYDIGADEVWPGIIYLPLVVRALP